MKGLKSILLLLIFLSSQVAFNMEIHFCDGKVTDVSFFGNAHCKCDMKSHDAVSSKQGCKKHCHAPKMDSKEILKKACCETEKVSIVTSAEFHQNELPKAELPIYSLVFFYLIYVNDESSEQFSIVDSYDKPLISCDRCIQFCSFLI